MLRQDKGILSHCWCEEIYFYLRQQILCKGSNVSYTKCALTKEKTGQISCKMVSINI